MIDIDQILPAFPAVSATAIRAALAADEVDADGFEGYLSDSFESMLTDVAQALRNAEATGPYRVFLILDWEPEGTTPGGQVIVHAPGGLRLAGRARELRHWVADRETDGPDALLDMAQQILAEADRAVADARTWLTDRLT